MSDNGKPNGAVADQQQPAPRKSLREIAEDAYDEVVEAADSEDQVSDEAAAEAPAGQETQPRDKLGRFAARDQQAEPGEAEAGQQPPPSPEDQSAQQQERPTQPAQAASSEAPANWSAADRETFGKLPQEAKAFLLRRHSEMEGDYQRRVTANATAANFAQSVAPYFQDPLIAENLKAANWSPARAVVELLGFHRRAISPDLNDRVGLLREMMQRVLPGVDPAAVFGQSPQGAAGQLSEQDLADPAIRYFADHVSRTVQDVQALRGQIASMQRAEVDKANAEALKVTRWGIDSFAAEKDAQGNLKHPHFDTVLPQLIELFQVNPQRDLNEAYQLALWMHPQTRGGLIEAERSSVQQKVSNERAKAAVRVNARGVTSPVSKPAPEPGSKPASLRETLEQSADEIGYG